MLRIAAALALLASPALAEEKAVDPSALKDCPPIGQSAKGELIYGMNCAALKPENRVEVMQNMPQTNLKDTVIPKPRHGADARNNADDGRRKIGRVSRAVFGALFDRPPGRQSRYVAPLPGGEPAFHFYGSPKCPLTIRKPA
ncbi:hypothetical protein UP10_28565 [Bradyrhizobium sp. LTSPM299]|nr:hypothetical protein UP10_28565 [Bradyrhizobium sp. LTSPM299]